MSTLYRRFGEESGIALPLAIMVMVLVGVMGAGMLTFVMTDLNSAVATNQGQRAFEMADAGVAVAKRQLSSEPGIAKYDGEGSDDLPWALVSGGLTLNDLDDNDSTADSVLVEIESLASPADSPDNSFKVISTGRYGDAKRKVEAVFSVPDGSGDDPGGGPKLRSWRECYSEDCG